jgi:hypothetical protein
MAGSNRRRPSACFGQSAPRSRGARVRHGPTMPSPGCGLASSRRLSPNAAPPGRSFCWSNRPEMVAATIRDAHRPLPRARNVGVLHIWLAQNIENGRRARSGAPPGAVVAVAPRSNRRRVRSASSRGGKFVAQRCCRAKRRCLSSPPAGASSPAATHRGSLVMALFAFFGFEGRSKSGQHPKHRRQPAAAALSIGGYHARYTVLRRETRHGVAY